MTMAHSSAKMKLLPKPSSINGGSSRKTCSKYALMAVLFVAVFIRPYHYMMQSISNYDTEKPPPQSSSSKDKVVFQSTQAITQQEQKTISPSMISYAPLLYHISPGSTGSRTLYHAAWVCYRISTFLGHIIPARHTTHMSILSTMQLHERFPIGASQIVLHIPNKRRWWSFWCCRSGRTCTLPTP